MNLQIGSSDFGGVVTKKLDFVDKTLFIKEVFDNEGVDVSLITRPRRFGKTFNLSTLHHFLAKEVHGKSTTGLFDNLKIAKVDSGKYMEYQGKYPVIFISFKDIKSSDFDAAYKKIYRLISDVFNEHNYLENSEKIDRYNKKLFSNILNGEAKVADIEGSLKILALCLARHHGVKPWVLIDEYDAPIQSGHMYGYYDEIVNFMRNFFSAGLKDNNSLNRAVITGVIRIAKESLFSDLNNLSVYSVLSSSYSAHFGYLESEVNDLLAKANLLNKKTEIKSWYNGYIFGGANGHTVYNPWSINNCIQEAGLLQPYWLNTSSNDLLKKMLVLGRYSEKCREEFEILLQNGFITKIIDENLVYGDLPKDSLLESHGSIVWSLLIMSGYIKVESFVITKTAGEKLCRCAIPNLEIRSLYYRLIRDWLMGGNNKAELYESFVLYLTQGNINKFEAHLRMILTQIASVHDMVKNPENFYHGLMMGLLGGLNPNYYEIKSNKESGFGRYDLCLIPKDTNNLVIILELKKADNISNLDKIAKAALDQINTKEYETEVVYRGYRNIIKIGIAFSGKEFSLLSSKVSKK